MKAKIRLGFDCLGIPSRAILMTDEVHLDVDKGCTSSYAEIEIEGQESYVKDIWSEGICDGLMCINATKEDLVKINEAMNAFCITQM